MDKTTTNRRAVVLPYIFNRGYIRDVSWRALKICVIIHGQQQNLAKKGDLAGEKKMPSSSQLLLMSTSSNRGMTMVKKKNNQDIGN